MNRRSFLMGILAAIVAWLLPKRFGKASAIELVEETPILLVGGITIPKDAQIQSVSLELSPYPADFPVEGLDEPRPDVIAFRGEDEIQWTIDGGYTWFADPVDGFEMTDIGGIIREIIDRQEGWEASEADIYTFLENS